MDFTSWYRPPQILTGWLAESWSNPDPQTFIVKVRQGVHWHDKPPMNGRELTAEDVAWTYRRIGGLLDWKPEYTYALRNFPWESIEATDRYTVEFKLTEPRLDLPEPRTHRGRRLDPATGGHRTARQLLRLAERGRHRAIRAG